MLQIEKLVTILTRKFNWVAAGGIIIMMLLTSADVVLRLFRHPIPGTYDIVCMLGVVVISFSLAYTSAEKGHIAVEFLVQKLPPRVQAGIAVFNNFFATILFALIGWQSIAYASSLKENGEVSLTLQMPLHPFVYGISVGCGLLCLVLTLEMIKSFRKMVEA